MGQIWDSYVMRLGLSWEAVGRKYVWRMGLSREKIGVNLSLDWDHHGNNLGQVVDENRTVMGTIWDMNVISSQGWDELGTIWDSHGQSLGHIWNEIK